MHKDSMRPFVPALVFAAAAGIAASPAEAQSLAQPRTWTVTPFLNTSLGIDVPGPEALETVLDNSLGLGVAVGYDLTHNLGFEGEIAYLFDAAGDTHDIDWSVSNFSANAVYHFDVKRITPYATFGLGVERSSFDDQDTNRLDLDLDPSATEVSINFGGGVKYPINTRWVARGDIRRFQANDIAPDYWRLYGGISWVVRR